MYFLSVVPISRKWQNNLIALSKTLLVRAKSQIGSAKLKYILIGPKSLLFWHNFSPQLSFLEYLRAFSPLHGLVPNRLLQGWQGHRVSDVRHFRSERTVTITNQDLK